MIASGILVTIITLVMTVFVLFAYGMSDAPQDKFSWGWTIAGLVIGVALILLGAFSGL